MKLTVKEVVKKLLGLFAVIACLALFSMRAQAEVLSNSSITDMASIPLSDDVIVEKIKTSQCNFDTSISALKALKQAGISQVVIKAMLAAQSQVQDSAPVAAASSSGDPNDPNSKHDAGIWLLQSSGGANKMTELEPALFSQMRSGSGWGMAWGATVSMKVTLNGATAKLQMPEHRPVFYFYFGEGQTGLNGATSPNEFSLTKLQIKKVKDDEVRLLVTGKMNAYSGTAMGIDPKAVIPVDFEKVSSGTFKVSPKADLDGGEYCFCQGAVLGTGSGKVFDFGVSDKSDAGQ